MVTPCQACSHLGRDLPHILDSHRSDPQTADLHIPATGPGLPMSQNCSTSEAISPALATPKQHHVLPT